LTSLETKISELLSLCEAILEPVHITAEKWVILSETKSVLRPVKDKASSLKSSWIEAQQRIRELPLYAVAKKVFEEDDVFAGARRAAGHWATFDGVLYYLFLSAASLSAKGISIDHTKALYSFQSFRQLLVSPILTYKASARLFGVNLRCKSLSLPDGVTLYRLNRREKNRRQPLTTFFSSGWDSEMFTEHPVEISAPLKVPVDHTRQSAFFENKNKALQDASELFSTILQAILLAFAGRAGLGPIDVRGGVDQIPAGGGSIFKSNYIMGLDIAVGKKDIPKICSAYDLLVKGGKTDKTLGRALHRFILGRQRDDLADKLVDYVIAWESILLTQKGNPITQELSYRFALNGASLISAATRKPDQRDLFKKVHGAYSTRSAIVHAADDKRLQKELKTCGFSDLSGVCGFLEVNFCNVVFWLASLTPDSRPYQTQSGWESLLWDKQQY
jgi:hypothetical protein